MRNATHDHDSTTRPERAIDSTGAEAAAGCPLGTPWCRNHQEGEDGWCTTRTVQIHDAYIDITNGTSDGHVALYGLNSLPAGGVDLGTAKLIGDTITALLTDVESPGVARSTAAYTWHDIAATDSLLQPLQMVEADRDALPFGSDDLRDDFRTYETYGGLLVWNLTRDEEGGVLVMLTGQTSDQERQVMANAGWMVSCGAVYAASRVGMKGWKTSYDDRIMIDGEELLVWVLPNDFDVSRPSEQRL